MVCNWNTFEGWCSSKATVTNSRKVASDSETVQASEISSSRVINGRGHYKSSLAFPVCQFRKRRNCHFLSYRPCHSQRATRTSSDPDPQMQRKPVEVVAPDRAILMTSTNVPDGTSTLDSSSMTEYRLRFVPKGDAWTWPRSRPEMSSE